MTNQLIRNGASYTTPEVPASPARPAYTSYETVTGTRLSPGSAANSGWVRVLEPVKNADGSTGYVERLLYDPAAVRSGSAGTPTSYTYVASTYHPAVPAVPGSPAKRVDVPPLGWTSFAHSIAALKGAGKATFKVPTTISGVAIGFSPIVSPTPGYGHIRDGLLFTGGVVRNVRTGASLGSYTAADVMSIVLDSTTVTFKKGAAVIGTAPKSSAAGESTYLSAVLYGAGDSVDVPTLLGSEGGTSTAVFPTLRAFSANSARASSLAVFPALTARSTVGSHSLATLPGLRAFSSDRAGGSSLAVLPALQANSYGGTLTVLPQNTSFAQFTPFTAASLLLVGETGTSLAKTPALAAFSADHPSGRSVAVLPALRALSYNDAPGTAYLLPAIGFDVALGAFKSETLALPIVFGFDVPFTALLGDLLTLPVVFGFDVPLSLASAQERVTLPIAFGFDVVLSTPGAELEVHAVNLEGFGSTRYANYAFNSFARIGDRYYGAKGDGLFLLEGANDQGLPIDAAICPGTLDFDSPQEKTISEVYVGVASESPMLMKVSARGRELSYQTLTYSEDLKQHRFKLGKGMKANYLTPVFYNQDGADFEIDSLEFEVATLSRKT